MVFVSPRSLKEKEKIKEKAKENGKEKVKERKAKEKTNGKAKARAILEGKARQKEKDTLLGLDLLLAGFLRALRQMVPRKDPLASIICKENALKTKNAEIGTLHCAQSFKMEVAIEEIIAHFCMQKPTPQPQPPKARMVKKSLKRKRRQQKKRKRPKPKPKADLVVLPLDLVSLPHQQWPQLMHSQFQHSKMLIPFQISPFHNYLALQSYPILLGKPNTVMAW